MVFGRLFGRKGVAAEPPKGVEYKGFMIFAEPIPEGKTYRISARITGQVDGAEKEHKLIRADTMTDLDQVREASIAKAKQVIDEQGARLFT